MFWVLDQIRLFTLYQEILTPEMVKQLKRTPKRIQIIWQRSADEEAGRRKLRCTSEEGYKKLEILAIASVVSRMTGKPAKVDGRSYILPGGKRINNK